MSNFKLSVTIPGWYSIIASSRNTLPAISSYFLLRHSYPNHPAQDPVRDRSHHQKPEHHRSHELKNRKLTSSASSTHHHEFLQSR